MQKCEKCGAELLDESLFCHKCGSQLSNDYIEEHGEDIKHENPEDVEEFRRDKNIELQTIKKKFSKAKIIAIVVGILVILGFIVNISNNAKFSELVKQADASMKIKDYSKAVNLFDEALTYKEDAEARENLSKAKVLEESAINFKTAMDNFKNNNFLDAIEKFSKIPKEDIVNYSVAGDKKKQSIALFTTKSIKDANQSASKKNYDEAVSLILKALKYDENNKQLTGLKTTYQKLAKEKQARLDAIAEAKAKAEAEKERKREEAEAKAEAEKYKTKHVTSSDNYNVWEVYASYSGLKTFKIEVTSGDDSNVICYVDGQLVVNEIGRGTYAMDINVDEGWHRIEVQSSMGYSWSFD